LASDDGYYEDGPLASTFIVEVDGEEIGRFTEVSGLEFSIEVESIQEGGQNSFEHKLPGRITWPNLVFKRGLTQSDNLFAWMEESSGEGFAKNKNKLTRATAAITLMSTTGERLREWSVEGAFPVKWSGPSLSNAQDDQATEELEIAHHGFRASKP